MDNKINILLENADNIELIRDQLCAILKVECTGQQELAKGTPDAADYRIGVWKGKSRPWSLTEDSEKKKPFPLVNVQLMGFKADSPAGPAIGQKKYVGEFFLDCYAHGEFGIEEADDTDSAIKAWKVGRVIRNILTSEHHSYLGLRGIVRDYKITEGKTGDPRNNEQSAQSITICRLVLSVDYYEDSPQVETGKFELYNFISSSPSGEVLFDITGTPGVNKDEEEKL
jgi:hypothetical protein